MAMLIAWNVLNKVTYPQDKRFSKSILLIAPGLTVKSRLQVLVPGTAGNYYSEFQIVPPGLEDKLRQGQTCRVLVHNWHKLDWESEEQIRKKRSVDKRGPKSDEAYVRGVLGEMASAQNIVVINDEAHHAWRVPPKSRIAGVSKDEMDEATKWIGGLDRIHKARGILNCFDLTATPFAPTGRKSGEETLFGWIVSDFGLNDAIESGLVKTPRVVVRDDGRLDAKYRSRFYHIYSDPDVKTDVSRKAEPEVPLPGLVVNGYYFLGKDWLETARAWKKAKQPTPPVMITVANTTHTAARVEYAFTHKRVNIDELCDPERILHIDSNVLKQAEEEEEPVQLALRRSGCRGRLGGLGRGERDQWRRWCSAEEETLEERAGRIPTAAGGHGWTCRAARRKDSKRNFRGDAFRGMGRQNCYAHHGPSRIHIAVALRAGCRARVAPHVLRD